MFREVVVGISPYDGPGNMMQCTEDDSATKKTKKKKKTEAVEVSMMTTVPLP